MARLRSAGGPPAGGREGVAAGGATPAAPWHALAPGAVLASLETSEAGLSRDEAARRLARHGPNRLPERPPPPAWRILLRQFASPLIYVLAAAALVSMAIGEHQDAVFIAAVLALNAAIGGFEEWKAERSARALQGLLRSRAQVLRGGELLELDAEQVVPGDVAWLEAGARVPADVRLLSSRGLEIDESALTGESLPAAKDADWIGDERVPVADRRNVAHAGTIVARGRARGVVMATGSETVVGRLALDVMSARGGRPPLLVRMERFSRFVAAGVLVAATLVGAIGLARGYELGEMFLLAVALAVSAIPEGLPVALTVALSVAAHRMSRRGVIVRRLAAVEGLGSCTFIASDKTGTLTCNALTVREIVLPDGRRFDVTGTGFVPDGHVLREGRPVDVGDDELLRALAHVAALCNEGDLHHRDGEWRWHGDPTDVALLTLAHQMGLPRELALTTHDPVNELPFDPERKYSASWQRTDGRVRAFVKGAPERVLSLCRAAAEGVSLEEARETAQDMAARGLRVLALADGPGPDDLTPASSPPELAELRLVGFVGMIDPLRPGARDAVAACRDAGIEVAMVTGDHPVTALAISRELGLATSPEEVVSGADIEGASQERLMELVSSGVRVFARTAPRQKLEIVEACRAAGHFVAVTGDGVNDAPALRAANIGVAMGRSGTDVAREAAELVVSDDEFSTIVSGVEEGRIAFDNVRKVTYLLISTGAAEVVLLTLSMAAGLPVPLLPVQLLWLNLVTNGIQDVALAFEPGERGVLSRPPRPPKQPIFDRLMIERTLIAAVVIGLVAFGTWKALLDLGWSEAAARNVLLMLLVLFENVHVGNCRSETQSIFRLSPLASPILLGGTILAFLVHVAALHLPWTQELLGTAPIPWRTGAALLALALTVVIAMELHALSWRRRTARRARRET